MPGDLGWLAEIRGSAHGFEALASGILDMDFAEFTFETV
jgi:hypothetical protein